MLEVAEGGRAVAGKGIRIAGIIAIVIAAVAAIFAFLNLVTRHPQREIAAFVGCAVFLILGFVLITVKARKLKI